MNLPRSVRNLVTPFAIAVITLAGNPAFAATTTGVPTNVSFRDASGLKYVAIVVGGAGFVAKWSGSDPCTLNIPVDSAKAMQSLASAALLAGKSVKISYNNCASDGYNYIYEVELIK